MTTKYKHLRLVAVHNAQADLASSLGKTRPYQMEMGLIGLGVGIKQLITSHYGPHLNYFKGKIPAGPRGF